VLQEWFHFVDKEKQVRIRIDGKVNQMIAEAAELKQWTITEVRGPVSQSALSILDMRFLSMQFLSMLQLHSCW